MSSGLGHAQSASLKSLLKISVPLMISALSGNAMIFMDRVILANYSTEAMNSAASAGLGAMVFIFGAISIASIAEVFVGQHNGAKQYHKMATPVWQMIFFSLALSLVYIPVAIFGASLLVPTSLHAMGIPYFRWMLCAGSLLPTAAALSGFFAGQGKVKIITYAAIISNVVNLAMDLVLVFGWGPFPELGATGAAIGTVVAQVFQVGILACVFLNRHNRQQYHTHHPRFDKKALKECIRVGYPNAVGHSIEMIAWTFLYYFVAGVSLVHVTVLTMGQNLFFLFGFLSDGLQKGVIAIASNLLGAGQISAIKRLLASAFKLHVTILSMIAVPMLLFPEIFLAMFNLGTSADGQDVLRESVITFRYVWLYLLFDGLVWVFSGILTSGGDTKFIMWANAVNAWLFAILPIYVITLYVSQAPMVIWGVSAVYALINMLVFFFRYRCGFWKKNLVHAS